MMPILTSLAAGVLAGSVYALVGVRSPAPPVVALVGLLGMVVGEQLPAAAHWALSAATHSEARPAAAAPPPAFRAAPPPARPELRKDPT